jgi:murein DD-endopeptidase MepM/ murein hydrolase activator NlpD
MEEPKEKKRNKVIRILRNKFRLVIINEETFEERFSLKLSLLNTLTVIGIFSFLLSAILVSIIFFTPVRQYIPGYANRQAAKNAAYAVLKTDSLITEIDLRDQYLSNLKRVLSGEISGDSLANTPLEQIHVDQITDDKIPEDSAMRALIEEQERYSVNNQLDKNGKSQVFFSPIKGPVVNKFDSDTDHFGVDIAATENAPIKAILDGTVIMSDYTTNAGYTIHVQHSNNFISQYKHCSTLLKKAGDKVAAGDAIALVGNTGELTTGPHLHFELWEKGNPVNPEIFIAF